jgi:hypothetical protein
VPKQGLLGENRDNNVGIENKCIELSDNQTIQEKMIFTNREAGE